MARRFVARAVILLCFALLSCSASSPSSLMDAPSPGGLQDALPPGFLPDDDDSSPDGDASSPGPSSDIGPDDAQMPDDIPNAQPPDTADSQAAPRPTDAPTGTNGTAVFDVTEYGAVADEKTDNVEVHITAPFFAMNNILCFLVSNPENVL